MSPKLSEIVISKDSVTSGCWISISVTSVVSIVGVLSIVSTAVCISSSVIVVICSTIMFVCVAVIVALSKAGPKCPVVNPASIPNNSSVARALVCVFSGTVELKKKSVVFQPVHVISSNSCSNL